MTAASQDAAYNPVEVSDLDAWASYYGLDFPVLADTGAAVDMTYDPSRRTRPTYVLIGPGMEIISLAGATRPSDEEIEAVLPIPYP